MTAVMDKENIISANLPPKQRAKHRYQLEQAAQAQMAVQLKKLQIIEEKLVQLQSINDEVFGELLALISEEEESSGLSKCLMRLKALKQEYAARREATDHRLRLRQAAVEANHHATLQHIRTEAEADQAETTVAVLHRQRSHDGKILSSTAGSSTSIGSVGAGRDTIQQRKRSLPSLLNPAGMTNFKYQYARRPSVPCTSFKLPIQKMSVADADLMEIKSRLNK